MIISKGHLSLSIPVKQLKEQYMKVRCSHCGAVVTIDGSKEVEQKTIDEKAGVIATYAECPECNGEVCFQVDNMYTIDLAKKLNKQVRKVAELKAQKKFNAALYKETNKNIQKLKFTQSFLEDKYKDKLQIAEVVKDVQV